MAVTCKGGQHGPQSPFPPWHQVDRNKWLRQLQLQQLGKSIMPKPRPTLSGVRNSEKQCVECNGRALHRGHQGPQSRALMGREHCTLTAWRGLDTAASRPALRGKGNSHTSGTQLQTRHPTGGWSREVRRKDDTSATVEPLCAPTCFPITTCLLSLAPCLLLPTLPPCAPHSSPLPHSLLSVIYATEQGLTATQHLAPSSWLQSH